jgi:hypothetical protein
LVKNADAATSTGAFIEEVVDDTHGEFTAMDNVNRGVGEVVEMGMGNEVGDGEVELVEGETEEGAENGEVKLVEGETEEGAENGEVKLVEEEAEEAAGNGGVETKARGSAGEGGGVRGTGKGNTRKSVASTGARSCGTPPARRVHSVVLQSILEADEDFLDASEEWSDGDSEDETEEGSDSGEKEENEQGGSRGDEAMRAAFTGARSCETPPARRVHPADLQSVLDTDRSSTEMNKRRVDEADVNKEERSGGEETNGDALKREASTGRVLARLPPRGEYTHSRNGV